MFVHKLYFIQEGPVCYNFKQNSTEPLLITRQMQNKPKLTIPCVNLKAGKLLTFELQVFNANNRYQSSQTASTIVVVEDRDIPQVSKNNYHLYSSDIDSTFAKIVFIFNY